MEIKEFAGNILLSNSTEHLASFERLELTRQTLDLLAKGYNQRTTRWIIRKKRGKLRGNKERDYYERRKRYIGTCAYIRVYLLAFFSKDWWSCLLRSSGIQRQPNNRRPFSWKEAREVVAPNYSAPWTCNKAHTTKLMRQ